MINTPRNPDGLYPPYANYAHAVEVSAGSRMIFISGLNGYEDDGSTMPESFGDQARLIWRHLGRILADAGLTYDNLV